jgi:choline dehydrogenase
MALQLLGSDAVYGDLTVPQDAAGNRRIPLPTGRGLGGGSAVNTMTWFQGHPADYDGWREQGADGWGWEELLPVARGVDPRSHDPDRRKSGRPGSRPMTSSRSDS